MNLSKEVGKRSVPKKTPPKFFQYFLLICFLYSCCPPPLVVYKETLSPKSLASWHAGTPDPCSQNPLYGERFWIFWKIPEAKGGELTCYLRFQNDSIKTCMFRLLEGKGYTSFEIKDAEFLERGEIISYHIFILKDNQVLQNLKHPLFVKEIPS